MHVSKKGHENFNRTGKKNIFHHENIAHLNRLVMAVKATIIVLKIKHLICLCKL